MVEQLPVLLSQLSQGFEVPTPVSTASSIQDTMHLLIHSLPFPLSDKNKPLRYLEPRLLLVQISRAIFHRPLHCHTATDALPAITAAINRCHLVPTNNTHNHLVAFLLGQPG